MRILLIQDDPTTSHAIEKVLHGVAISTCLAPTGAEGILSASTKQYDVLLVDALLPDMTGYDLLQTLRSSGTDTPALILSDTGDIESKLLGFSSGADDYLIKPLDDQELVARIHAVIRRSRIRVRSIIRIGRMAIDLDSQRVQVDGKRIHLTGKEYAILDLLARRKGSPVTKEALLNHLYAGMNEPEPKIIDVFICKMRKKLEAAAGTADYIETIWGRGYALCEPAQKLETSINLAG